MNRPRPAYRTLHCAVLCLVLVTNAGCTRPSKLYSVPIGAIPISEMEGLVSHYREKFRLEIGVLNPITIGPNDVDPSRRQGIAENMIQSMQRNYSDFARNRSVVLIGITAYDLYPRSVKWEFCLGWRADRAAIVSTARMSLHYPGEPIGEASLTKRLHKMVTKDIGILYYGMPASSSPRSVLYKGILGLEELDRVSEDF